MISKFADNIRGGIIDSEDGYKKLLQAPDQLDKWVEEWLIRYMQGIIFWELKLGQNFHNE